MNEKDFINKFIEMAENISSIKGDVRELKADVKRINGSLYEHSKKLSKLDVFYGKVGFVVIGVLFVGGIVVNFVIDWFKQKVL